MSVAKEVKLKKGYDIQLEGSTSAEIVDAPRPKTIALKPCLFRGIKPKLMVSEDAEVKCGTPLFCDKNNETHIFTSPVSGKVTSIQRGRKRVIEHIVIELDGKDNCEKYKSYSIDKLGSLTRDEVLGQLMQSGMLGVFRQRPFDYVADPKITPRDIFVSTFDTAPLAPDLSLVVKGNESFFQAGLNVAAKLTKGKVHLSIDGKKQGMSTAFSNASNVTINQFSGPHPGGCVGVQIHHLAPINGRDDKVWYATVQGIILLGKLFLQGKISPEIIVSVAGSAATNRKYFRTILGANIESIIQKNVQEGPVRIISGNVLTGQKIEKNGYLGFYDSMVTVIPESAGPELIGWMLPGFNKESFFRTFLSPFIPGKKFVMDTKLNGGIRALFSTGFYERVLPMKLYPIFLIKSILAGDIEEMEGLGIYEITEEEIALCEYICPSKVELQKILRDGLTLIEKEG